MLTKWKIALNVEIKYVFISVHVSRGVIKCKFINEIVLRGVVMGVVLRSTLRYVTLLRR